MSLKDSENLRRIEELRPRYERLRDLRIRNAADGERAESDLKEACRTARELADTDELEGLRARITENYAQNTAEVDEFALIIAKIEAALDEVEGRVA